MNSSPVQPGSNKYMNYFFNATLRQDIFVILEILCKNYCVFLNDCNTHELNHFLVSVLDSWWTDGVVFDTWNIVRVQLSWVHLYVYPGCCLKLKTTTTVSSDFTPPFWILIGLYSKYEKSYTRSDRLWGCWFPLLLKKNAWKIRAKTILTRIQLSELNCKTKSQKRDERKNRHWIKCGKKNIFSVVPSLRGSLI